MLAPLRWFRETHPSCCRGHFPWNSRTAAGRSFKTLRRRLSLCLAGHILHEDRYLSLGEAYASSGECDSGHRLDINRHSLFSRWHQRIHWHRVGFTRLIQRYHSSIRVGAYDGGFGDRGPVRIGCDNNLNRVYGQFSIGAVNGTVLCVFFRRGCLCHFTISPGMEIVRFIGKLGDCRAWTEALPRSRAYRVIPSRNRRHEYYWPVLICRRLNGRYRDSTCRISVALVRNALGRSHFVFVFLRPVAIGVLVCWAGYRACDYVYDGTAECRPDVGGGRKCIVGYNVAKFCVEPVAGLSVTAFPGAHRQTPQTR